MKVSMADVNKKGNMVINQVVDNSVAMRWLVANGKPADQRYARQVRDFIQAEHPQIMVPYLWTYEAANVVANYVRRGELEYSIAVNTLQAFNNLFTITIDRGETPVALFESAEVHGVTAHNAAYLLLARHEGLPQATLDKKMRKAAKGMGIDIFGQPNTEYFNRCCTPPRPVASGSLVIKGCE